MDVALKEFFVAVTDSPAGDDLSIERDVLAGMRVEKVISEPPETLVEVLRDCDALMCMHTAVNRRIIGALRCCKVIARFGTGLDNIDIQAAAAVNIPVIGVHDYCTEEVSDHVLALLLSWQRKILEFDAFVRRGTWNQRTHTTGNWGCGPLYRLSNKTLGVVGFGRIGRAVAKRALAFGMKVLAYSRNPSAAIDDDVREVEFTKRDELLARSDYISLHLPLSVATEHWINSETIRLMKRGSVLINTARGRLVDDEALAQALNSGQLGGALLDVYEDAPLPLDHPLRSCGNVIFTPHVAFYSEDSLLKLRRLTADAVKRMLQ